MGRRWNAFVNVLRDETASGTPCSAMHPLSALFCTRRAGHKGKHVAHGSDDQVFARWSA